MLIDEYPATATTFFAGALEIRNSEEKDQGKYECVAENSIGTEYSKPAQLYVKGECRFSN